MFSDLVSFIIPVYNAEVNLDACLGSIVNQTYQNLEIILVDDGSTDSSGSICEKWARSDSRITVLHKPNGGQSDARNTALDICAGEYIVFTDSDDTVHPEYVQYLHDLIKTTGSDLAVCEYRFVTPNGKVLNRYCDNGEIRILDQEHALWELCDDTIFSCSPWAKMYTKQSFKDIRYPVGHIFEDVATTYKLFLKAEQIAFGRRALYNYIRHEGSTGTSSFQMRRMDSVYYAEKMCDAIVERWPSLYSVSRKRLYVEYINCLGSIIISKKDTLQIKQVCSELCKKIRNVRYQAWKNRLTMKQRYYVVSSFCGDWVFKQSFLLENWLYRLIKLRE